MSLKYNKVLFIYVLTVLISGCGPFIHYEPGRHRDSHSPNQNVTYHNVKAGETLYSIAFEYGHDHREVARWNNIAEPYTIFPKQKLRVVPGSSEKEVEKQDVKPATRRTNTRKSRIAVIKKTEDIPNAKLEWEWPTEGKVVSTFSIRDPGRRGIDIVGDKGQPVKAAAAGRVVYRGNGLRGYGNLIILKHNETFFSAYAHTEDVVVKEDENVKLGQRIADMSNTGSDKTKLHFEIRRDGKPVNPMRYLPKRH